MVATIQQFIGKINPLRYATNGKELLKKYGSSDAIPAEEVKPKSEDEHKLIYDSSSETLEPIYFFILDMINDMGMSTEKLVDNFSSSPGSGHFAELGGRATIMQQQGTKILGDVNTVLRSVLNVTYDLREFNIRLQEYTNLKSKDGTTSEAAFLALKQIWMDKVDILRGNSSIKAMALSQVGFQTLIDAFMVVKDGKDVNRLDLNDRIRRILLPRISEFNIWVKESEKELRKRYELEKTYLRSQVNSLKLYSRWAKPYLKAAQDLENKDMGREPALVKAFNTILLELTLLGKSKLNVHDSIVKGDLAKDISKMKLKRDYFSCVLVNFRFRGIPQKVSQQSHFAFGGRAEVVFSAYALNQDEIDKLNEELSNSDMGDVLKLIDGITTESLDHLQDDINFFLEESEEESSPEKSKSQSNPFMALIGRYEKSSAPKKKSKKSDKKMKVIVRPEDFIEKTHLRPLAASGAVDAAFSIFDVYKKSHGMPSYT